MATIDMSKVAAREAYDTLINVVVPRPIAFVSSISISGNVNLSPFSFFNMVCSAPPTLVFSVSNPARGGEKDTICNVRETREAVINLVSLDIVEQMNLASAAYPKGVDEFRKSGLRAVQSMLVSPPRVAEAPASFECAVRDIIPLGKGPGGANLVICEVLATHVSDEIYGQDGVVDPAKIRAVSRLGGEWYSVVREDNLFKLPRVMTREAVGVDTIPSTILNLASFTSAERARLGLVQTVPSQAAVDEFCASAEFLTIKARAESTGTPLRNLLIEEGCNLVADGGVERAWLMLSVAAREATSNSLE